MCIINQVIPYSIKIKTVRIEVSNRFDIKQHVEKHVLTKVLGILKQITSEFGSVGDIVYHKLCFNTLWPPVVGVK